MKHLLLICLICLGVWTARTEVSGPIVAASPLGRQIVAETNVAGVLTRLGMGTSGVLVTNTVNAATGGFYGTLTGSVIDPTNGSLQGQIGALKNNQFSMSAQLRTLKTTGVIFEDIRAEPFCQRVGATSLVARQQIHDWFYGLKQLGIDTNLVDFAFFDAAHNSGSSILTWSNAVVTVGNINRLPGGLQLPNAIQASNTNWFYITNLPTTTTQTVVAWVSADISPVINSAVMELAVAGWNTSVPWLRWVTPDGGGMAATAYDGATGYTGNNRFSPGFQISCVTLSLSGSEFQSVSLNDIMGTSYPNVTNTVVSTMKFTPVVLRFGTSAQSIAAGTNCWSGLIRGFALFNKALTPQQIAAVNALVPRIGVIIEGDSKSVVNNSYYPTWVTSPNAWGLLSVRTNSAVSGTCVSHLNGPGTSMEDRWATCASFTNCQQFPINIYSLRGGQNDVGGGASNTTNAWNGLTNLWTLARSNGFLVQSFTGDHTSSLWTGSVSNSLIWLNAQIRGNSGMYDYLADVENYYTAMYGPLAYTNLAIYQDGVHENTTGMAQLGSNAVSAACSVKLFTP